MKEIIVLTGSYIGLIIGSGIATGQEIMQYYSPHGYFMIVMALFVAIVLFCCNWIFGFASKKQSEGSSVFRIFFSKKMSKILDVYVAIFCFLSYIIMVSGASSTTNQQFELPPFVGSIFISVLVLITVLFGLKNMSNFLGTITPIMLIFMLVVSAINLLMNWDHIDTNIQLINQGKIEFMQIDENWLLSIISNTGLSIIWLSKFSMSIGKQHSLNTIGKSSIVFGISIGLIYLIIGFSILSSFDDVSLLQIPNLLIAYTIWPPLSYVLSIIIFIAIYTSACPLLWSSIELFAKDKTKKYYIFVIIFVLIGLIISFIVPYADLLNTIFKYNGYVGFAFFILIVVEFFIYTFQQIYKKRRYTIQK